MHFYIFLLSALFIMQGYSQHFTSKDVSGDPDHLIVTIYLIKEQFNPLLVALIFESSCGAVILGFNVCTLD